ncbi:DUF3641 domain-containing protein, partial [Limnohabitans sp.]
GTPAPPHLADLLEHDITGQAIAIADHCYGCTAGQGSSCGGALEVAEPVTASVVHFHPKLAEAN